MLNVLLNCIKKVKLHIKAKKCFVFKISRVTLNNLMFKRKILIMYKNQFKPSNILVMLVVNLKQTTQINWTNKYFRITFNI